MSGAVVRPERRLLYLVHGATSYYQEAAYSLLSLWRQPDSQAIGIVVVTDPVSLMPQAEMIAAPRRRLARSTSTRGIGAPDDTKVRSVPTS